ncbi:MAG: hypothetical protein EPO18_13720 [Methylobacter sp.]|nr:MAG: hypothetical protein EPO18_13720 [Methylobacter sp.]
MRRAWKRPIVQLERRKPAGGTNSIPSAAPSTGAFGGNKPDRGAAGSRALPEGHGRPFWQPPAKARNAGSKRQPGRLFFGYFLLAKQKKVSRPRGRDPDSNNLRASDTTTMTVLRSCGGLPSGESTLQIIRLTAFMRAAKLREPL